MLSWRVVVFRSLLVHFRLVVGDNKLETFLKAFIVRWYLPNVYMVLYVLLFPMDRCDCGSSNED